MSAIILFLGLGMGEIFGLLLSLAIFILIFLALRGLFLWYWKINLMILNQEKQIDLLRKLVDRQTIPSDIAEKARKYDEMSRGPQP